MLTNDSYIDGELSEHFADLVYSCTSTSGVLFTIALLLEHKSYPAPDIHLQLLRYIVNRWQEDVAHQRKWTPVVPVVIYHGATPWLYKLLETNMSGITDSLRPYLPSFHNVLIDLSILSEEQTNRHIS